MGVQRAYGKPVKLKEASSVRKKFKEGKNKLFKTKWDKERNLTRAKVKKAKVDMRKVVYDSKSRTLSQRRVATVTPEIRTIGKEDTKALLVTARKQIMEGFATKAEQLNGKARKTLSATIKTYFNKGEIAKAEKKILTSLNIFNSPEMLDHTNEADILKMHKSLLDEIGPHGSWSNSIKDKVLKTVDKAFSDYLYQRVDRLLVSPPEGTNDIENLNTALDIMDSFENSDILIRNKSFPWWDACDGKDLFKYNLSSHFAGRFKIALGEFFTGEIKEGTLEASVKEFQQVAERIGKRIDQFIESTPGSESETRMTNVKNRLGSCYKLFRMNYDITSSMFEKVVKRSMVKKEKVTEYFQATCEHLEDYAASYTAQQNHIKTVKERRTDKKHKTSILNIKQQDQELLELLREATFTSKCLLGRIDRGFRSKHKHFQNYNKMIVNGLSNHAISQATTKDRREKITQNAEKLKQYTSFISIINEEQIGNLTQLGVNEKLAKEEITAVSKREDFSGELKMFFLNLAVKEMTVDMKKGQLLNSYLSAVKEHYAVLVSLGVDEEVIKIATEIDNKDEENNVVLLPNKILSDSSVGSDNSLSEDEGEDEDEEYYSTPVLSQKKQLDSSVDKPIKASLKDASDSGVVSGHNIQTTKKQPDSSVDNTAKASSKDVSNGGVRGANVTKLVQQFESTINKDSSVGGYDSDDSGVGSDDDEETPVQDQEKQIDYSVKSGYPLKDNSIKPVQGSKDGPTE